MFSLLWRALVPLIVTAGGLAAPPGLALAQPPAGRPDASALTLDAALRRALASHPDLAIAAAGVEAAEGRIRQAGLRPNPELGVAFENFSGDLEGARESETTVELSNRFEVGGKRQARLEVARADRLVAEEDLRTARLDLWRDLQTDFVLALAAQRQLALAEETLALAREVAATAQRKVEAGALPAVEATRARVAIFTSEMATERARQEASLARERLALHWGGTPVPDRLEGGLDSLAAVPDLGLLLSRLDGHPHLERWNRQIEAQRVRIRLERSSRTPDVSLGGGYRRFAAEGRGAFLLGLSTELPLRHRNQGAVLEAEAEARRGSREMERARRGLERDLREQSAHLFLAQAEVRGLRRTVLPGAREVFDGVQSGYAQGRFTYLDVLEARRFLAEAQEAEIAALSELERSRIELERLTGGGEAQIGRILEEER